ncbi:MAG: hypothetical protein J5563_00625 [Clostridia bacterium]|nr:hypothetical protein [Clostridia bacterium]
MKNGMKKDVGFYIKACVVCAAVTAVLWYIVWRVGYDTGLGVFNNRAVGIVTSVLTLLMALAAALPYFFGDRKAKVSENALKSSSGAGAAGAFLAGCCMLVSGIIPITGGQRGALAVVAAVLSVPGAAYFILVSLTGKPDGTALRVLVFFPVVWGVTEVLLNYFSVSRAINDPKKIITEFIPIAIMLFVLCEARTRWGDCLFRAHVSGCGIAVLVGSVGLSVVADELTGILMRLLSNAGIPVSADIIALQTNYGELALGACGAATALYAFCRLRSLPDSADTLETVSAADETEKEKNTNDTEV